MTSERDMMLRGLPPADSEWAEFEAKFLQSDPACPLSADLEAAARDTSGTDAGLSAHIGSCLALAGIGWSAFVPH